MDQADSWHFLPMSFAHALYTYHCLLVYDDDAVCHLQCHILEHMHCTITILLLNATVQLFVTN